MQKIVTGLVLVALLVGALGACGEEPTPVDPKVTAELFLNGMVKAISVRQTQADYEAACQELYNLLSADTQATVTLEDFQEMLKNSWNSAGVTAFEIVNVQDAIKSRSGSRASVPYQAMLTTRDATTEVFNALSLVLQDGQWRVIWPPAR